jgi:nicotinamidase-related amidase
MLDAAGCCLVVVDVQGKLAQVAHDKEKLFANCEVLIKTAKGLEFPVIWCEQNPKALGPTIEQLGSLLTEEQPIAKYSFSCCGNEEFSERVKSLGRKQYILCGIESHVCIYQTAMDLKEAGLEVEVVADAVSSRTAENKNIALRRMEREGVKISCTEMVLFELLKTAKHEKFKELARLIK